MKTELTLTEMLAKYTKVVDKVANESELAKKAGLIEHAIALGAALEKQIIRTRNAIDSNTEQTKKTVSNVNVTDVKKHVPDVKVYGNGDLFRLIAKASSVQEGWLKSTKAMEIPGVGCLVQVSTQQGDCVAEALAWVPGIMIRTTADGTNMLVPM